MAAKQAALEKIASSARTARDLADKAAADLDAARKQVADGPRLITSLEADAVSRGRFAAAHRVAIVPSTRIVRESQFDSNPNRPVGRAVVRCGAKAPDDRGLAAAAADAKTAFDRISLALESADHVILLHAHDLQSARTLLASTNQALDRERTALASAPQLVETRKHESNAASIEAKKLVDAQQKAASEVAVARTTLQALRAELSAQAPSSATTQPVATKN